MTGRYWDDSETMARRIARAHIVAEYTNVGFCEYIRRAKGRDW